MMFIQLAACEPNAPEETPVQSDKEAPPLLMQRLMTTELFTMELSADERQLLTTAAAIANRSEEDLVRSILFPQLKAFLNEPLMVVDDPDVFKQIRDDLARGQTPEDAAFQKKLFEEEEKFWAR